MNPVLPILLATGLALSAYFSMVEIVLLSANRLKLREDAHAGNLGARLALGLLADRENVLATTLVGVNLANLTVAALATSLVRGLFPSMAEWKGSLLTTASITLLILLLGEIIPKVYGRQRADRLLPAMARPVLATEQLLLPITATIRLYLRLLLRILRRRSGGAILTREDLKLLVHDVKGETGPGRKEKRMLRSILDFSETAAREVMVPMTEVVSVEREASCDMVRALVKRHGVTRLPVYERRVDQVIGLVNVYDILFDLEPKEEISAYIRPALLVPETKRIDRLMAELQRGRQTMAVVVSEFGSCVGIVTMEDIIEEIVGELAEEDEVGVRKIRQVAPSTYIVDALTDLDDINEELGCELPKGRYDTLSGLILRRFGRIPQEGDWFEIQGVRVEVVDAHRYGVRSVKMVLPDRTGEESGRGQNG